MIRILLHYTSNWSEIADIVVPNLCDYADKNNYGLRVWEVPPYEKYTGLQKIKMFNDYLERGDVGLILDCDTLITNHKIKVESLIDDEHDLFLAEGINCGVLIVRKTEWTNWLFNFMQVAITNGDFNCEQDAIEHYIRENKSSPFKILPHPSINSYKSELYPEIPQPVTREQGQWREGDFICHFPALSLAKRVEEMKKLKIKR